MTATYCVAGGWYYIEGATLVGGNITEERRYSLWDGWIWVSEKKYHTESTVTLIGITSGKHPDDVNQQARRVVLEMRRGLTVKTLKDGPPVYVIHEQVLT